MIGNQIKSLKRKLPSEVLPNQCWCIWSLESQISWSIEN